MSHQLGQILSHRRRSAPQAGVYALEYALVFPIFFLILYAVLGYGLLFTVRLSLQNAAEEGARAALKYQVTRAERLDHAEAEAKKYLTWLSSSALNVSVQICTLSSVRDANGTCLPVSELDCASSAKDDICSVEVSVRYDYEGYALAPNIPGLNLFYPSILIGRSSVLLERI